MVRRRRKEVRSLFRNIWFQEEVLLRFAYTTRVVSAKSRHLITLVRLSSGLRKVFITANLWSGSDSTSVLITYSLSRWALIRFSYLLTFWVVILLRTSDSSEFRDRLIRDGCTGCEKRKVNSVIFVVNAVEFLKSMENETSYAHMIFTAFNCPLLSFKGWLLRFFFSFF